MLQQVNIMPPTPRISTAERFLKWASLCVCLLVWLPLQTMAQEYETGDLIFQQSRSAQSLAIQQATGSRYSHMGMIVMRDGAAFVIEAAAKVRYHPLADWIAQGERGHYVIKRLHGQMKLEVSAQQQLAATAETFLDKPYDLFFAWSDEEIYCSELVWKIYQRSLNIEIGTLQPLRDFNLQSPAVQSKMRERYGAHIPWDEPIISPAAMFESKRLILVEEG